jgi:hypothetical protein
MKSINNFAGLNGFVWWVGAVENTADPAGMGRCQVRIFGWHTPDVNLIPTLDLPWAHPLLPMNSSNTISAPAIGSWVVGFFLDSENGQFPVMMGVLPGLNPTSR